jgi:nucleotide-binding universal stress UspA family protein
LFVIPYRAILFPTDFSEASIAMAPYVTEIARRFDGTVTVLNAFNLMRDYDLSPHIGLSWDQQRHAVPYANALQERRHQRQHSLEKFCSEQFPNINVKARIEDGEAAAVIEWVAHCENTDLIMMPTKGIGKFRRLLMGSVTAKVLHDTSGPIFTSAHPDNPPVNSVSGFHSIVYAVAWNEEAGAVLRAAGFLADAYGAKVCLVHVEASIQGQAGYFSKSIGETLTEAWRNVGMGAELTVRLLDENIADSIRRAAVEEKADLIVVGRGHATAGFSRIWSHLYAIIRESPCPVLSF